MMQVPWPIRKGGWGAHRVKLGVWDQHEERR